MAVDRAVARALVVGRARARAVASAVAVAGVRAVMVAGARGVVHTNVGQKLVICDILQVFTMSQNQD